LIPFSSFSSFRHYVLIFSSLRHFHQQSFAMSSLPADISPAPFSELISLPLMLSFIFTMLLFSAFAFHDAEERGEAA